MGDDAPHWSEEPSLVVHRAAELDEVAPELTVQGAVTQRIADVSPTWADAAIDPTSASAEAPLELRRDRAIGVEAIREGWLLHRGAPRLVPAASPDLSLLIGDWCYAAGLCAFADHGTLDDVAALAALVTDLSARAAEPIDQLTPRWQSTIEDLADG